MIVGLDELEFYIFFVEEFFDCLGCYVVHNVVLWTEAAALQIFYVIGEGIDDGSIGGACNWCC